MATLGKYELHEMIGKGGFGTVYRATDTALKRVVAIKVLHPQLAADSEYIERFQLEARMTAELESSRIVSIYDVGEDQGRHYIVMRYCRYGSLADLLKQGPLSWARSQAIILQVCDGLNKLHRRGWIHRDLKPSNILFDDEGMAVISDFGLTLAKRASGSSSATTAGVGTPFYRAPEVWRGRPAASPATDVYSLGCVLAEMLTGRVIFPGDTPDEVITRHLVDGPNFGPVWPPANAPAGVRELVGKAIARDPKDRYADASSFAEAVNSVLRQSEQGFVAAGQPLGLGQQSAQPAVLGDKDSWQRWLSSLKIHPIGLAGIGLVGVFFAAVFALLVFSMMVKSLAGLGGSFTAVSPTTAVSQKNILTPAVESTPTTEVPSATLTPRQPSETPSPTKTHTATYTPTHTQTGTATLTPTPAFRIGSTRVSPQDGMVMMYIPAGEYQIGTSQQELDEMTKTHRSWVAEDFADEIPQHRVRLQAFWIDRTEVTNDQFMAFTNATGYETVAEIIKRSRSVQSFGNTFNSNVIEYKGSGWKELNGSTWRNPTGNDSTLANRGRYPVVWVTWDEAVAYCAWAGRSLPNEDQWEAAARGSDSRLYPWGNSDPDFSRGNYALALKDATQVGKYPAGASVYGVFDMAGNVWEWTSNWYQVYPGGDSRVSRYFGEKYRGQRGGAYDSNGDRLRTAVRGFLEPSKSNDNLGFRCAMSAQ